MVILTNVNAGTAGTSAVLWLVTKPWLVPSRTKSLRVSLYAIILQVSDVHDDECSVGQHQGLSLAWRKLTRPRS